MNITDDTHECMFISPVFVHDDNEDSVDIYDGLDLSFNNNAGESPV